MSISSVGSPNFVEETLQTAVKTKADGSFQMQGLFDRPYTIKARDPQTFLQVLSEPLPVGSHKVRLQLPSDSVRPNVRGRVVSPGGCSLKGVKVSVLQTVFSDEQSSTSSSESLPGNPIITDAEGRFEIKNAPTRHIYLSLSGEEIQSQELHFETKTPSELNVTVSERIDFHVDAGRNPNPDWLNARLQAFDKHEQELPLRHREAGMLLFERTVNLLHQAIEHRLTVSEDVTLFTVTPATGSPRKFPVQLNTDRHNTVLLQQ